MALSRDNTSPPFWDPVVRLSHWVIAGVVVGNALLNKGGGSLHVWLGWIGMMFLIARLVWGFVGPAEARFSAFPPKPRAAIAHLSRLLKGERPHYRSHNPAGAIMIYALWASLAMVIGTGLIMTKGTVPWEISRQQTAVAEGDWSALVTEGDQGDEGEDRDRNEIDGKVGHLVESAHEFGGNLLLLLAVIHLGGVAAESMALRRNIVRPMVLGRRR